MLGMTPLDTRFFSKVNKQDDGCWIWTAGRSHGKRGHYGKFCLNSKTIPSHRASWIIHNGDIPDGLFVLHHCDVMLCVNPDHLYLGDHKQNMRDRLERGRHPQANKTHCKEGHELEVVGNDGRRGCKTCRRETHKQWVNDNRERLKKWRRENHAAKKTA